MSDRTGEAPERVGREPFTITFKAKSCATGDHQPMAGHLSVPNVSKGRALNAVGRLLRGDDHLGNVKVCGLCHALYVEVFEERADKVEFEFKTDVPDVDVVIFYSRSVEHIRLEPSGAIYVRGERVDDNKQVYAEFLAWLKNVGMVKP